MKKIRWAICGSGHVAEQFVSDLKLLPEAEVVAVWSYQADDAESFGLRHNIPHRYSCYDEMLNQSDIDVVYVCVPSNLHMEMSVRAMDSNKAVLCEKPIALNLNQTQEMMRAASRNNVFLMEAMWTRFFPAMIKVREIVRNGEIGEILQVQANFGFRVPYTPAARLFNPALGGGALLDCGVYGISMAYELLGQPLDIKAVGTVCSSGVDVQNMVIYKAENGGIAQISSALVLNTPMDALILGTAGSIYIHPVWFHPSTFTLTVGESVQVSKYKMTSDTAVDVIGMPYEGHGYHFEAAAVMDSLRKGEKENTLASHADSLAVIKIMDEARAQMGVRYPCE